MRVSCPICEKVYCHKRTLNAHLREKHQQDYDLISFKYNTFAHKCLEGCNVSFNNIKALRQHLQKKHKIVAQQEIREFSTFDEFTCWLTDLNKDCVQYVYSHSKHHRKNYKTLYYYCNRAGNYMPSVLPQNRKRKLKSQGSCKINGSCTSAIIAIQNINLGTISITYYKTHYTHKKEVQHIRITRDDHAAIAAKLISGVTIKRVLEDNRQSLDAKVLIRKDLITRRDIHNVKNRFHIDIVNGVLHENDAVSVNLWAAEYKKHNFLYYKKQGEEHPILDVNDICLIFMNSSQEHMLKLFGSKIICVDSTHGLNKYDFQLTTVMIIDDYGEGFPCASMFSNRIDTSINEIFFDAIKSRVGLLSPKSFMTDITATYINAWEKVMGSPKHKLYCSWHIDRAWKSNLSKINNQEKKKNVYKTLKYLQYTLDESKFICDLNRTITFLHGDEETAKFGKYFQENYLNNYKKWAYSFRKNAGINTNMHVESMHKTIKYYYLEAKKIKRLDKGIFAIISYIRNKIIERIIKNTKGQNSNHISEIDKRHKKSISSSFAIEVMSNELWRVNDKTNKKVYTIARKIDPATSCCNLICKICNICVHTYQCTCVDYCIRYTICKHIHYVVLNENRNCDNVNLSQIVDKDSEQEIFVHMETVGNQETKSNSLITDEIKALGVQLTNFDYKYINEDVLVHIKKTMQNCFNLLSNDKIKKNETFNGNCKDQVVEPPNKKITKQETFCSTKKKTAKNKTLTKPNYGEAKNIQQTLSGELYISFDKQNDHIYN